MSAKEELWKLEYYKCFNATEAARRVGYRHPNAQGPRLKLKFNEEIAETLAELTLTRNQVLARLSDMATADIADFADVKTPKDLKGHPKSYLIKKMTPKTLTGNEGQKIPFYEMELHDAQSALRDIGKHLGLFDTGAGSSEDKPLIIKVVKGVSSDEL